MYGWINQQLKVETVTEKKYHTNEVYCWPTDFVELFSSSGSSLTSWLTPGQVYEKSREDPEIGSVYWFIGLLVMFYVVQANTMSQQDHNYSFYIM